MIECCCAKGGGRLCDAPQGAIGQQLVATLDVPQQSMTAASETLMRVPCSATLTPVLYDSHHKPRRLWLLQCSQCC